MSQTFVLHPEIFPVGKIDSDANTHIPTAGGSDGREYSNMTPKLCFWLEHFETVKRRMRVVQRDYTEVSPPFSFSFPYLWQFLSFSFPYLWQFLSFSCLYLWQFVSIHFPFLYFHFPSFHLLFCVLLSFLLTIPFSFLYLSFSLTLSLSTPHFPFPTYTLLSSCSSGPKHQPVNCLFTSLSAGVCDWLW